MGDIVKAIEKEKEYLEYRKQGKEPFHLVDAIKECGFESLSEYFKEKKDYEFRTSNFTVINAFSPELCVKDIFNTINNKKNAVIFVDIDYTVLWSQINSKCDFNYCIKNNIPIIPLGSDRGIGALVSTPGDFGIGICIQKKEEVNLAYIIDGFIKIFKKYTDKEIIRQNNDIMYNGKKVCGFTFYDINNMFMVITPVSFTEKAELVSKICLKKQNKKIGYIDFMDRDMLKKEVIEWLQA